MIVRRRNRCKRQLMIRSVEEEFIAIVVLGLNFHLRGSPAQSKLCLSDGNLPTACRVSTEPCWAHAGRQQTNPTPNIRCLTSRLIGLVAAAIARYSHFQQNECEDDSAIWLKSGHWAGDARNAYKAESACGLVESPEAKRKRCNHASRRSREPESRRFQAMNQCNFA